MGKPARGSRKGKKAWRANIATDELDDFYAKTTNDVLTGAAALPSAPSDSLFFVDKSAEIPVKRKIEKNKGKLLNHEKVFQKNPFVQVIPSSSDKKLITKKKKAKKEEKVENKIAPTVEETTTLTDIWDNKGGATSKSKKNKSISNIPAVELEPPGCSFNPPFEAHQDALAKAVADEMHKIYKKELGPEPVPLTVPGEEITEEDMYFLDADHGNKSEGEEDEDNVENGAPAKQSKTRKLTKVELNRKARHKEQLRAEVERKKLKNLSKEIDSLPKIMEEIAKEDEEKNKRHMRRVVAKQERLKSGPPRLGKHKFEPAPMQVLLTEEISGSLRKLKGCPTLTRDRFKSFEKRGLIVPRAKGSRKK